MPQGGGTVLERREKIVSRLRVWWDRIVIPPNRAPSIVLGCQRKGNGFEAVYELAQMAYRSREDVRKPDCAGALS